MGMGIIMWKYIITALVALELVLLSSFCSPAAATINDTESYIWDYAYSGSSQFVCKQVIFHPIGEPVTAHESLTQPAILRSHIVDSSHCKSVSKPS